MKDVLLERFISYAKIDTKSDPTSETCPSTKKQFNLLNVLKDECERIGLVDVSLDENGYLMATLPSNVDEEVDTIGFVAHVDTAPDFTAEHVNPQVVQYQGGDIVLNKEKNVVLKVSDNKVLNDVVGHTLITTDGLTLLGADDKCGIAEIMTAFEYLVQHPEIKHGTLKLCFTPDEEIGRGADLFKVTQFNAAYAYTIDGGALGELEFENFNAAGAVVTIQGLNIHPGYAKNKMKNSILIASDFFNMFNREMTPQNTSGYEGFVHLNDIHGSVDETKLHYIIRDFDELEFENKKQLFIDYANKINEMYGEDTVKVEITDQYRNMKEIVEKVPHIVERAEKAMRKLEIEPLIVPIRGGTDGARLSYMGLPCPNIFTGGYNYHGRYEFAVLEYMELACKTIIEIAKHNNE